ncbi:MAG TPA: hypothetical protein VHD37_02590 [Candidatus Paceibacterota bacterium]|nr:hypothetical protein [Candidatus Paceibacterota bacterium]
MINEQLLNYIKEQLASGGTKDNIQRAATSQGWNAQDVNEAFANIEGKILSVNTLHPSAVPGSIANIPSLFRSAFLTYKKRWVTLILLTFLNAVLSYALFVVSFGGLLAIAAIVISKPDFLLLSIIGLFGGLLIMTLIGLILMGAMIRVITDASIKFFSAIGWAIRHLLSIWWLSFLFIVLIFGGISLFIIPGFTFLIWFMFGIFVYSAEGLRGFKALFQSKEYVRGHFWSVVLRFLPIVALTVGTTLLSFIRLPFLPYVIWGVTTILTPLYFSYIYSLYVSVKSIQGQRPVSPKKESRVAYLFVALVGLLLPGILTALLDAHRMKTQAAMKELEQIQAKIDAELQSSFDSASSTYPYSPDFMTDGMSSTSNPKSTEPTQTTSLFTSSKINTSLFNPPSEDFWLHGDAIVPDMIIVALLPSDYSGSTSWGTVGLYFNGKNTATIEGRPAYAYTAEKVTGDSTWAVKFTNVIQEPYKVRLYGKFDTTYGEIQDSSTSVIPL